MNKTFVGVAFALGLLPLSVLAACGGSDDGSVDPGASSSGAASSSGGSTSSSGATSSSSSSSGATSSSSGSSGTTKGSIKTVFMILMENHNWSAIKGSKSATYINGTLIPAGAHAENYKSPAGLHPSEPNYIWLEAGDNLGITTDDDPDKNHRNEKDHFTTQLEAAGVSWKAYVEDIDGKSCPLASSGLFAAKHVPMLYFDDVTDTNSPTSKRCIDHIRPYTELEGDLGANKAAQYNFITPNLCNDMHGETFGTKCQAGIADMIKKGDDWLAAQIPKIQASKAYNDGGVIIIVWDEGDAGLFGPSSDGPVPMIVLSKQAKAGFASKTDFTHSSMLKTLSLIFGVKPLRGAATANDLGEMFTPGAF